MPAYGAAGAGVASSSATTLNVAYPASVGVGDVLILQTYSRSGAAWTTPSGFTLIQSDTSFGSTSAYYKVADGTESGTLAVTVASNTNGAAARMYRFDDVGGAIVEGEGSEGANSATVPDRTVTTTGPSRLAVNLVAIRDDFAIGSFSGATGGTWTEPVAEYTALGTLALQIQTASIASAGTINGGSASIIEAEYYAVIGFALIPLTVIAVGQALETDSALSITPVLTPAGLVVAVGQATETDSAFSMTPVLSAAADIPIYAAIDFGTGFEEITSTIRTANIRRGRPFNLDRVEAGTCDATAANGDGALDPSNTESVWFGKIHPLTPLRILRREGGITYERFNGPIERFLPHWSPPFYQEMEVQAADSFESLANTLLVSDHAVLTTNLTGSNNDLVFTAVEAGGQGDDITVEYIVAGVDTALGAATNEPLAGSAIVRTQAARQDWALSSNRPARVPIAVSVQGSDITVNVATNGAGAATSTATQIKAALEGLSAITSLVTIEHAPGSTGAGVVTAMAKTNLFGGKWLEELSGARINRILDLAGWDAALRDVDLGNYLIVAQGFSIKENVSALAHIQDIADSELGYVFMRGNNTFVYHDASHRNVDPRSTASRATFTNDGGSGFEYQEIQLSLDKDRIVNEATVTGGNEGAAAQTASDTYSQTGTGTPPTGAPTIPPAGYGKRAISRNTLLANDSDALAQAEAIVTAFAYPLQRLESLTTYEPTSSDAWVASVLDLDIGDLITVNTKPPSTGESPTTSYSLYVEEIADTITAERPWAVAFRLTSAGQSVAAPPPPSQQAILNSLGGPLMIGDAVNGIIAA